MKAVVWHGKRDVRTEEVPDPILQAPNDAIIRVTSSGICGSGRRRPASRGVRGPMSGQANVKRWVDDLMPLLLDDRDPLGTEDFATHRLPLEQAPHAYDIFQKKEEGAIKVLLQP